MAVHTSSVISCRLPLSPHTVMIKSVCNRSTTPCVDFNFVYFGHFISMLKHIAQARASYNPLILAPCRGGQRIKRVFAVHAGHSVLYSMQVIADSSTGINIQYNIIYRYYIILHYL